MSLIGRLKRFASAPETAYIPHRGGELPLPVRRSKRSRRMALKLDLASGAPVLVLPDRTPLSQGLRFAERHADWIARHRLAGRERVPFEDGAVIPYRGRDVIVRLLPPASRSARGAVRVEDDALIVFARPEEASARIASWLKFRARDEIAASVARLSERIGKSPARISIRDQKSRWGSCSSRSALSFSWRLILAPEIALDYVVAHEVAHLAHHHHGPEFWALAEELAEDMASGRAWMKAHGAGLHRYG